MQSPAEHDRSWLATLMRLWLLKRVAAPRGDPRYAAFALSTLWLLAWVAIDRWQRQPEPRFYADGIPLLAWYGVGLVMLAGLLRRVSNPRPTLGAALALAVGLVPVPLLLTGILSFYLSSAQYWVLAGCAGVFLLLYLARGLHGLTGSRQRFAALSGLIFIAAFLWLTDALNAIPDVWSPASADAVDAGATDSEDVRAQKETTLFEQADRIDAALDSIHRGASPAPQAFFVGFAGVGAEKVFAQEIGLASRVLQERYAMDGRGLSLINDERDLDGAPIASVSGLRYALRSLAERMQVDRDVLFLSISSHGSEAPAIAVENSDLPLAELSAQDLAEALRDSGIRWRVIMISACYAGGFIEPLRDPRTILITAAAADRTSFGCSSDSDLTYFGEAFYRDALPAARSLRDAFETAKAAIAARERSEGETPSNPQAYFGAEIEAKIDGLAAVPQPAPAPAPGPEEAITARR